MILCVIKKVCSLINERFGPSACKRVESRSSFIYLSICVYVTVSEYAVPVSGRNVQTIQWHCC